MWGEGNRGMTRSVTNDPVQRRDRRQQARQDRRKIEEQRHQREKFKTYAIWGVIGLVVASVAGLIFYNNFLKEYPGEAVMTLGNTHVEPGAQHPPYNSNPPTSGWHYNNLARWGIHTEPVEDELQVHNLEDGGVVIQYNCPEGCPELVSQLAGIVNSYRDRMVLAPRTNMDTKIALTAWGRIDKLEEFDEARIRRFVGEYRGIDHHPVGGE